jgi:L-2,4-diaminobutyrate decarboxylase
MINWMLSKLGWLKGSNLSDFSKYPKNGSGILTHGGSIANLTALSAARAKLAPEAWTEGNPNDLVVIGPASAHYSISRALSIMGMGKKAFVPVPVDSNEIILTSHLERVFKQVKSQNKRVMAVVANACATSSGLFDPIEEMATFCEKK